MTRRQDVCVAMVGVLAAAAVAVGSAHAEGAAAHYSGTFGHGASWIADIPQSWNGTLILFSHGFGPLLAQDAPITTAGVQQDLLDLGYGLVGSSYAGPSLWALDSAVDDQFAALDAIEHITGPARRVIGWGESMGGLVSALEAERGGGRLAGVLTTCGIVAGALNLNNYQLDGQYALHQLLAPELPLQLVGFADVGQAVATGAALSAVTAAAQATPQGRARTALAAALMNEPIWFNGPSAPGPADYAAQEAQQAQELVEFVLPFTLFGRYQIEMSAGGNSADNIGVDYAELLRRSVDLPQVQALYRAAGLDLDADLATLTGNASISATRAAGADLADSSMVTGKLTVPALDIHTIHDQLVPVEQENWYAQQVRRAGAGELLRQAYIEATGHCNFQSAGLIAALHALEHRLDTGRWDDVTTPAALNGAAVATRLGPAAPYIAFDPPALTGSRR